MSAQNPRGTTPAAVGAARAVRYLHRGWAHQDEASAIADSATQPSAHAGSCAPEGGLALALALALQEGAGGGGALGRGPPSPGAGGATSSLGDSLGELLG